MAFISLRAVCLLTSLIGTLPLFPAPPGRDGSDLQQWRREYAAELAKPDGWFSLVALQWLAEGDTTVGSAPDNKLKLRHLPAHAFSVRQQGGHVSLTGAALNSCVKVNGAPARSQPLASDDDKTPSILTCNGVQATVIHRGDRLYLRVKDSAAPTRTHFTGLHWFAPNPSARVTAKWVPYGSPHRVRITNVLGQITEEPVAGYAEFTFAGHAARLEPLVEDDQLFFIFRDETRHTETYGAGRFLYTALPDHGLGQAGTVVLDFNEAHNPPCAYTAYATCPLPPIGNRLSFSIPAGEKRYHD